MIRILLACGICSWGVLRQGIFVDGFHEQHNGSYNLFPAKADKVPEQYSWLVEEDEGADMQEEEPVVDTVKPGDGLVLENPEGTIESTPGQLVFPEERGKILEEREDEMRKDTFVRQTLSLIKNNHCRVGDDAGGLWDTFSRSDEECVTLLKKEHPSKAPPIEHLSDFIHKSLSRWRTSVNMTDAFNEKNFEGHLNDNPNHYLPSKDITQILFALIARQLVQPRITPVPEAKIELLCGDFGRLSGLDHRTMCRNSSVMSLIDSMQEKNKHFGETLAEAICDASDYWLRKFDEVPSGLARNSALGKQIIREALVRTNMTLGGITEETKFSLSLAHVVDGYLHAVSKGTTSVNIFRRNARARFQRIPIFSTLTGDYTSDPDHLASFVSQVDEPGMSSSFLLKQEDIIVMLSDGITDNMYMNEISSVLTRVVTPHDSITLHTCEDQLQKRGVEWALPAFNSQNSNCTSPLRFTTNPTHAAAMIGLAARYHISEDAVAGPTSFQAVLEGRKGPLGSRTDDTTAVVCYATTRENYVSLFDLWNLEGAKFTPGSPSLVRPIVDK